MVKCICQYFKMSRYNLLRVSQTEWKPTLFVMILDIPVEPAMTTGGEDLKQNAEICGIHDHTRTQPAYNSGTVSGRGLVGVPSGKYPCCYACSCCYWLYPRDFLHPWTVSCRTRFNGRWTCMTADLVRRPAPASTQGACARWNARACRRGLYHSGRVFLAQSPFPTCKCRKLQIYSPINFTRNKILWMFRHQHHQG